MLLVSFFVAPFVYGQVEDPINDLKIFETSTLFQDAGYLNNNNLPVGNSKNKSISGSVFKTNGALTVSALDLNGTAVGVNHLVLANVGFLYPTVNTGISITSSSGTVTSAKLTFSTSSTGVPAGVQNANDLVRFLASNGSTVNTYNINATSATVSNTVYGSNNFRITHNVSTGVFDITDQGGLPIDVANLQALLRNTLYAHSGGTVTEGSRYMVVSVTDPNNTLTAYTEIRLTRPPVAVDDVNSIAANSIAAITGNLTSNDTDPTTGDTRTITEVHGYASKVGSAYTTTFGTITVQSNGTYSYNVDVNNTTVKGLKTGVSITDIISYQVRDIAGNVDFGYLTVTINGVTEPPVATDNTNNVTVGSSPVATGNVISDDTGLGSDRLDRNTSLFVWESQYTNGAIVNGTTRTLGGVNLSFVQDTPAGVGGAGNQTVDFTTNGGHTGYLLFASDPAVNPAGDNKLTINFNKPVTNISFTLSDIDFSQSNTWQDQMRVVGTLAGATVTYNKQVAGSIVQTGTDTFYGTGSVPANDAHGNVTISFNSPINKLEFYYNYGPAVTAANPGGQIAGLTDLVWQDNEASGVLRVNGLTTNVGVPVAGTYGTFIIYANGNYTYTLNSTNPAVLALTSGQTLTDSIPYSISDNISGAGNIATANLIITITCTPPAAPTVAIGAATCNSPGTATITNYDSSSAYTFSPVGPTVVAGGVVSNLTPNTSYTVTATVGGGGCTSNASSAFSVNPSQTPSAPTSGTVTQPTCSTATGSFQITGYSASNTYTFTPSVVSISGTGLVTATAGTYTFTQMNAAGCISPVSSDIVVNAQPATPSAPTSGTVTQPTCSTATGSFQITGYSASNTYTFTPSVVSVSGTGLVTATAGTYTFTQTNAAGCISPVSSDIVVNAQPATPSAPTAGTVTQPTCATATGSFQITGYTASNTYTFTPSVVSISGTGLVTATAGTYTFTQTNAAGCISPVSSDIVVNAQPATPAAPTAGTVTQPTCSTATGSFQITGYSAS
ncbi:beta strand repeat-containing protein, partial [Flavobacterium sp. GSP14]|uniref:beta strand repeat-containing protein n=1 Tax=Flavobacterium sp. GSP14 TaxID=3401734 RepID=UPI003AAFFB55